MLATLKEASVNVDLTDVLVQRFWSRNELLHEYPDDEEYLKIKDF